jgi:hypothetical protein
MLEPFFFVLGIVNSLLLIAIFLLRRRRLDLVKRLGWVYFLLGVPAAFGIVLAIREGPSGRHIVFLALFLAFLLFEWLLDYSLKIDFRENMKKHWKVVAPYLALYYAMNYGFIVMPWKTSLYWGLLMLALFVVQMIANLTSHPRPGGETNLSRGAA